MQSLTSSPQQFPPFTSPGLSPFTSARLRHSQSSPPTTSLPLSPPSFPYLANTKPIFPFPSNKSHAERKENKNHHHQPLLPPFAVHHPPPISPSPPPASHIKSHCRATPTFLRHHQGLQDKIKLVPLNIHDRPSWYGEKVYSINKVPALEYNGKISGESIDLIKYVDASFEGPSLLYDDPAKKAFAEELFSYADIKSLFTASTGDRVKDYSMLSYPSVILTPFNVLTTNFFSFKAGSIYI